MKNTMQAIDTVFAHAKQFIEGQREHPAGVVVEPQALRAKFAKELQDQSIDADCVIDELIKSASGGLLGTTGGRFFGWVIGGSLPAALAADLLVSTWDQNAAMYACSPAAAVAEEVAGAWLKDLLNLPAKASFAFVTGCQMAHFTALAAARHRLLADRGWDVEMNGLFGAPQIHILTTRNRHESLLRAARFVGFGTSTIVELAQDELGRMRVDALKVALEELKSQPAIVVLQAGDINTGQFDSFVEACAVAHEYQAWVHVDGAFGLWAATSARYKHLTEGCQQADSWSIDGHKWLNVPFDSGFVCIRDSEAHRRAMTIQASYLIAADKNARDQIDWNPEWSRRARGFVVYAALRSLGRNGVSALVETCCEIAMELTTEIGSLADAEIVALPVINQGLVRFAAPDGKHDSFTDAVIEELQRQGVVWFGGTTWQGMRAMRISVCNWQTDKNDIMSAVDAVRNTLSVVKARYEQLQQVKPSLQLEDTEKCPQPTSNGSRHLHWKPRRI